VLILEEHVWWMRQQKLWGFSRTCSIAGTRCLLYDGIHSHGTTYLTRGEDARRVYEKARKRLFHLRRSIQNEHAVDRYRFSILTREAESK
jgi:hypothetical protein